MSSEQPRLQGLDELPPQHGKFTGRFEQFVIFKTDI